MADRTVRFILTGDSAGAVRAMSETAAASEAAGSKIGDTIDRGTTKAGQAINKFASIGAGFGLPFTNSLGAIGNKFEETSTKGMKFGEAISSVGRVALLGGAAALVGFGAEAVNLGNKLEDSQASLKAAVDASHESLTQYGPAIDATRSKMESLGFSNADVNNALAKSVISTQNVGRSLQIMGLAADLARAKHVDLATATQSLDRALTGNLRPLMQMGISLPVVATSALKLEQANNAVTVAQAKVNAILAASPDAANAASSAHVKYQAAVDAVNVAEQKLNAQHNASNEILQALSQRLGGQAAAAAETFSGKLGVLKTQAEDVGAQIGTKLIPILSDVLGWLIKNKAAVEAAAIGIGVTLVAAIGVFVGTTIAAASAVDIALGGIPIILGLIVTGAALLVSHWHEAMTDLKNWAADAVNFVIGSLNNLIRAFDAVVGKIPFFGNSLKIPLIPLMQLTNAADQATSSIARLHAVIGGGPTSAGVHPGVSSPAALSAAGIGNGSSPLDKAAAHVSSGGDSLIKAGNAGLVAAQSTQAANAAGLTASKSASAATTSAAKAAESEAKKRADAAIAEQKRRTALLVADNKAGQAALNTQLNLTTSTSLSSLAAGLNSIHNAALQKLVNTLEATHKPALVSLANRLVDVHKQALANWVAQQKAAAASAALAAAGGQANIIGLQEQISEDTANMAGLSSDALAVAQAQLVVDQKKLDDAQQAAKLQSAVDAATTATAKANAQAALDSFNAQATIDEANNAAALSAAQNRQTLVSNGQLPALAAGGLVTKPTLALVGESGPEIVVPLTNVSTKQPAPLPAGAGVGNNVVVNVQSNANPQEIAHEVVWGLKTA